MKGRASSLFAWGLLVGAVALLVTVPSGLPTGRLAATHLPAAILFALAGLVFGLAHPEGRAWVGGFFLGWVPAAYGVATLLNGNAPTFGVWLAVVGVPAVLAGVGAGAGAAIARRRPGVDRGSG